MEISSSQCNSASESGWTSYLDQSSLFENRFQRSGIVDYEGKGARRMEAEEEEDLSMVSDASSGPPHYHHEDDQRYCTKGYPSTSRYTKKSEKKKAKEYGIKQQPSPLDDTASSPVLHYPNSSNKNKVSFSGNGAVEDALDYSQCFSATRIKTKPKFQKHFNFFGGKHVSEKPGGFDGEERK